MDEKWFFSTVIRRHLKSVPFLGIKPVIHGLQSASNIYKEMMIVTTAYAPHNNVIDGVRESFPVSITRVGRMQKAYRRVYQDDGSGSFHYPGQITNKRRDVFQRYGNNWKQTKRRNQKRSQV